MARRAAAAMRRGRLAAMEQPVRVIDWPDEHLELRIEVCGDGMARLTRLSTAGTAPVSRDAALPLLDMIVSGEGRGWSGGRYCESEAGSRFRYVGHTWLALGDDPGRELRVDLDDPATGMRAGVFYRVLADAMQGGGVRSWVRLENRGVRPVMVESVTSFLFGGIGAGAEPDDPADLDLLWAEYDWMAEGRWQGRPMRDVLPDIDRRQLGADPRGCFA
jgi:alpha-galactosidase